MYKKQIWENRVVERPLTYIMQENADGTVTLIPAEGRIIREGTKMDQEKLNHIENALESLDEAKADLIDGKVPPSQLPDISSLPNGGTTGQVLQKQSEIDRDVVWADIQNEINIVTSQETEANMKINDRKVYVKCFEGTNIEIASGGYAILEQDFSFADLDIIKMEGCFSPQENWQGPLPCYCSDDKTIGISCNTTGNLLVFCNFGTQNITLKNFILIIYYMKKE